MFKVLKKIWRGWFPWYKLIVDHRGKERIVIVKKFDKKTPKHIKGVDVFDQEFEFVSVEPMDYYIIEYKEDLK
jgi:hypothetical protein